MEQPPVRCLYEDGAIAVCVKPAGLLSEDVPGGLIPLLKQQLGLKELYCVHRLDRGVGGVMVTAKKKQAAAALTKAFTEGTVHKRYLAVVSGVPEPENGEWRDLLFHDVRKNRSYPVDKMRKGVKEAVLTYRVLGSAEHEGETFSLSEACPVTGRSHQIRVQFASRKHPLAGDGKYGSRFKDCPVGLFCFGLDFSHPVTAKPLSFTVRPPETAPWTMFPTIPTDPYFGG